MSDVEQWEHDEQLAMENEIISLREQVERLKAELTSIDGALNDPRANLTLTTSEIIWELKGQVEKLTKELDNVKQVEFPRRVQKVTDALKRKHEKELAALAEQNEKLRKVLLRLACLGNGDQYGNSIGNCIAQEALSLPDLTSPMLNRIRAEEVRMASTFISLVRNYWASAGDNLSVQAAEYLISALDTRADELEKTNG